MRPPGNSCSQSYWRPRCSPRPPGSTIPGPDGPGRWRDSGGSSGNAKSVFNEPVSPLICVLIGPRL